MTVDFANELGDDLKQNVIQTRSLFSETYYKWKYQIYRQYALKVGQDIDILISSLQDEINLDAILWDVADWWVNATINGLAGRLHTKYYFYSQPLTVLNREKATGLAFKAKIAKLKIEANVASQAQKTIDEKIALIDSAITSIQSKGWSGMLNLQTLSAKKRAELLPNNQKCQEKSRAFLIASEKVTSLESFDANCPLYKETVEICVK